MFTYYLSASSAFIGLWTESPWIKAIPTTITALSTFVPKLLPIGLTKRFTVEERDKLGELNDLMQRVAVNLNVNPESLTLRVTRQFNRSVCMIGMTSSFGGPLMCMGNQYFDNYRILESMDHSWLSLLNEIPDSPIELGKYLDNCTSEKRMTIFAHAKVFQGHLSKNEMHFLFAREICHAKQHHMPRKMGALLLMAVAFQVTLVFSMVFALELGLVCAFASIPMLFIGAFKINRNHENEAHEAGLASKECRAGYISFQKKELLSQLSQQRIGNRNEVQISGMLASRGWFSSQPNNAKKLYHAVNLSEVPSEQIGDMSKTAKLVSLVGILSLLSACYSHAKNMM